MLPERRHHFKTCYKILEPESRDDVTITIGFSTTNKWISKFIRWITKGNVSHAWIAYFDETLNQRMVLQAEAWGYESRPWKRWRQENIWVAEYAVPDTSESLQALREITKYLGTDYDYSAAFFVKFRDWLKRKLKAPIQSPDEFMCSESVIRFLSMIFTDRGKLETDYSKMDPEAYSPVELHNIVKADPRLPGIPLED